MTKISFDTAPVALLASLQKRGVTWQIENGNIRFAGVDALANAEIAVLRARKSELLAHINEPKLRRQNGLARFEAWCAHNEVSGNERGDLWLLGLRRHGDWRTPEELADKAILTAKVIAGHAQNARRAEVTA